MTVAPSTTDTRRSNADVMTRFLRLCAWSQLVNTVWVHAVFFHAWNKIGYRPHMYHPKSYLVEPIVGATLLWSMIVLLLGFAGVPVAALWIAFQLRKRPWPTRKLFGWFAAAVASLVATLADPWNALGWYLD